MYIIDPNDSSTSTFKIVKKLTSELNSWRHYLGFSISAKTHAFMSADAGTLYLFFVGSTTASKVFG
jgi:hypothetical protein